MRRADKESSPCPECGRRIYPNLGANEKRPCPYPDCDTVLKAIGDLMGSDWYWMKVEPGEKRIYKCKRCDREMDAEVKSLAAARLGECQVHTKAGSRYKRCDLYDTGRVSEF